MGRITPGGGLGAVVLLSFKKIKYDTEQIDLVLGMQRAVACENGELATSIYAPV